MKKIEIYKLYIIVALFFGTLFIILTPPFNSPDEINHFKKAYQVSKFNLYAEKKNNKYGDYFPNEIVTTATNMEKYMGNRDEKFEYSQFVWDQVRTTDYENQVFDNYGTAQISFVPYVPSGIGILFSKICARIMGLHSVTPMYMLYFARFFNLIVVIFLTSLAIKIIPTYKKTVFTIACLPMLIFLNSMVSYDGLLNAIMFLTIAIILDIIYNDNIKKIPKKYVISLILMGLFLFTVKKIYFLIFLLMFTIPKSKFGDSKGKIKVAIIMIAAILITSLLIDLPYTLNPVSSVEKMKQLQISCIKNDVFRFLYRIFSNIYYSRFFYINGSIGLLGLLDTYLPVGIVFLTAINLLFIGITEGLVEKQKISRLMKLLCFVYIIGCIVLMYTAMYIGWTPQELKKICSTEITGVQGRYFIPLMLPFILLFSFRIKSKNIKKITSINKYYLCVPILSLTVSVICLLLRYWI